MNNLLQIISGLSKKISDHTRLSKKATLIFLLLATIMAISTLISELRIQKDNTPPLTISPTPSPIQSKDSYPTPFTNSTVTASSNLTNKYTNNLLGFSFEFPKDVALITEDGIGRPSTFSIFVKIDDLTDPDTSNIKALLQDQEMLSRGDFGIEEDSPYLKSTIKKGSTNIKIFARLKDNTCESVVLEKVAQFYRFDRRITLIFKGPKSALINEYPNFFTKGEGQCEGETLWTEVGIQSFLSSLKAETIAKYVTKWDKTFAQIISTLEITSPTDPDLFKADLKAYRQGENMVIAPIASSKLGEVVEMKLWYGNSEEGSWEPIKTFVTVPTKERVNIRYKDKYGNVSKIYSVTPEIMW